MPFFRDSYWNNLPPGSSWCNNIVEAFAEACDRGDESEAKSIAEMDPVFHNKVGESWYTGLMLAEGYGFHFISRWLLSRPGLDTSFQCDGGKTALHYACQPGFMSTNPT